MLDRLASLRDVILDLETHHLFALDPSFGVSYELLLALVLLLALLDCSLQDPGQGLGYQDLTVVDDTVSSSTAFGVFGDTSTVLTTAVSGSIWGDWRRVHDLTIEGETLKRLKNCSGHCEY